MTENLHDFMFVFLFLNSAKFLAMPKDWSGFLTFKKIKKQWADKWNCE